MLYFLSNFTGYHLCFFIIKFAWLAINLIVTLRYSDVLDALFFFVLP